MPGRAKTGLLRLLPPGMAVAATYYLWRLFKARHAIDTVLVRDINARKQVHEQLARSFAQLRELSSALQTIREEERRHIARELHDDLGQLLATLRVNLTLARQHADMTAPLLGLLHKMDSLLVTAISSLRRIASNLRPRALDEGGLYFALQTLRHDFLLRQAVHFELMADEGDLVLDDERSTAIYRIVQEALTNIARHAEASHITIALHRIDSMLSITIQDDGKGITDRDLKKAASLGLLGMRERVWGLNGSIQIGADSELGGTRIDIMLPMPASTPPP
ncbi:sensor histidine kinase [Janthinobacterium sp. RB2R34]|uniref:sensor histidine kinase n=1 Tax=Janthinobacterium sp. RB2R34 TaxID=3424193 RepID=UPI003F21CFDD